MKRFILNSVVSFSVLSAAFIGFEQQAVTASQMSSRLPSLTALQLQKRVEHAKELMGSTYKKSVIRSGESVKRINKMIYVETKEHLPSAYKKQYQRVAQSIIDSALKHGLDPVFVMAVIQSESSFDPTKIGGVGEIGLMQIRPTTARWIAEKFNLKYRGDAALKDPKYNIQIGTLYFSYLREKFKSHAQLYIAAYNMGQGNVREALQNDIWPEEYPKRVMNNYVYFYEQIAPQQIAQLKKSRIAKI